MRRLEYIGGSSEKFWEGTIEGTGVVVSWGRIGTAGQTKVKDFADLESAEAFLAKQVAEKLKKGYVDAGAPASTTPPAAKPVAETKTEAKTKPEAKTEESGWPDEDTFDPAPGVVRMAFPRRDQARPKRRPDPDAVATIAKLKAKYQRHLDQAVAHTDSDPDLADAVRRHEAGEPNPLGAAAVGTMVALSASYPDDSLLDRLGRAWLTEYDLLFAAEAAMALPLIATVEPGKYGYGVTRVRYRADGEYLPWRWPGQYVFGEIRAAIAAADDQEYAAVVERLAALRTNRVTKLVAAFLAPTETEWLDGLAPDDHSHQAHAEWLYLCAAHTAEQLDSFVGGRSDLLEHSRVLPTIVRTVGPGAAPALLKWSDGAEADALRRVLTAVAEMPTDVAFRGLLECANRPLHRPAVQAAMQRFPLRATRILASAVAGEPESTEWLPAAKELLRAHLIAFPALRTEVVPTLEPAARAAAEATLDGIVLLPEASPESLPEVLASPPWTRTRKRPARVVLADLDVPAEPGIDWLPGERETAAKYREEYRYSGARKKDTDWQADYQRHVRNYWQMSSLLMSAPIELATEWVGEWRPTDNYDIENWGLALLSRFELAALDLVVTGLGKGMGHNALLAVGPVLSTEVATMVAEAYARLKSARPAAQKWLLRHGVAAVPYLLPAALGAAGKARDNAELALRTIAGQAGAEAVVAETKRVAGDAAADGVAAVLATDPLELLPKKLPVPGAWAQPASLPQIRLRDKDFALPAGSTADLLTMLALGKPGEPYGGVAQVAQVCDPASLAEFGWQVFDQWRKAGSPSKDGWALTALGVLGDDETVRRLAPVIRAWPGEGGHARAVTGLDVLTDIGTDVALMHLNGIAQKVKFGGLKAQARERIELVALNLGLTSDELADRLVPDLGLAEDGTMVLDYGPRKFVVGFDEQLRPFVSDEDGKPRKALPKPGAKDDAELAEASYQRFSGLKKDVRTLAADQIRRLEQAMVTGRQWTPADFGAYFAGHPLLWHVVRRLVWGVHDESGALVGSFRLAEDRTFADVEDETYAVPEGATVGVAHPLHLGDALASWAEVFADYEILQPFPQLGRPTFALTDAEREDVRLARFENVRVPIGKVLGLTKRGWERATPQDGGVEPGIVKPLPDGRFAVVYLSEGIVAGDPTMLGEEQSVERVFLSTQGDGYWFKDENLKLSTMDDVAASELIADLTEVVSGGAK